MEGNESRGGDEDIRSRRLDGGGPRQTKVGRRAAFHGSGSEGPSGALTLPIARCVPSVLCAPNLPGISSVGRAPAREAGSAGSSPAFLLIGLSRNQANTAHNRAAVVTTANSSHGASVPRAFLLRGKRGRESECVVPRRGRAATAQPVEGVGAISSCRPPGGPAHRPLPARQTDSQGAGTPPDGHALRPIVGHRRSARPCGNGRNSLSTEVKKRRT